MIPQLQASATITGHGVLEIGGVGQRATNPEFYGGGIVDANGKADYIVWARNFAGIRFHDFTLKGANVAGLVLGDPASSFSDNAWVTNMWIDRGSYRHTHIRQLCLLRNLHGSVNHNNQCKCNGVGIIDPSGRGDFPRHAASGFERRTLRTRSVVSNQGFIKFDGSWAAHQRQSFHRLADHDRGRCMASQGCAGLLPIPRRSG